MIQATLLRPGMAILHDGNFCRVMSVQHTTPGNKRGFVQAKLRNLQSGNSYEHRFRSEDRIEKASLEEREMEFLYASGDQYHFMNTETYEQMALSPDTLGEAIKYIIPNTTVMVEFFEDQAIGIDLPTTVDLKVVETPPGMKGATASGSGKPATLETGLQVTVPQFVEIGEVVRIDTNEGKYLERAK